MSNQSKLFILLGVILIAAGGALFFSEIPRDARPKVFRTTDNYNAAFQYPSHWRALQRGVQVVFWTTLTAAEGRSTAPELEKLENNPEAAAEFGDFVITTFSIASPVRESLESYADYAVAYADQHPGVVDGTRLLPTTMEQFADLRYPHLIKGDRLFIQLGTTEIATVQVRMNAGAAPASAAILERQAIGIITSLERTGRETNDELNQIKDAVERALSAPPPGGYAPIPKGVRLLSVSRNGDSMVLEFNQELLSNGTGGALEDAIHQILTAASNAAGSVNNYRIFIAGRPLDSYLK